MNAFALSVPGGWYLRHVSPRLDPPLVRLTRGRVSTLMVVPAVLLKTVGARTGQPRVTPLTYFSDGDRVVLMASNYGQSRPPAWYFNVKANPEVRLEAGGVEARYRGEEATGAERERLWALAKQHARNYEKYEQMTVGIRQIPVMVFSPLE